MLELNVTHQVGAILKRAVDTIVVTAVNVWTVGGKPLPPQPNNSGPCPLVCIKRDNPLVAYSDLQRVLGVPGLAHFHRVWRTHGIHFPSSLCVSVVPCHGLAPWVTHSPGLLVLVSHGGQ